MPDELVSRPRSSPPGSARERRPAVWPWLVMPLIVLLVFYALYRVHQRAPGATAPAAEAPPPQSGAPQR